MSTTKNLMKNGVTNYNQVMSRKDNKITNVNNVRIHKPRTR